jgi:nucleoside-diphosphate-sugar epimerase
MSDEHIVSGSDQILVTGSSGFIGAKVVEILLDHGFVNVRCLVRPTSRLKRLKEILEKLPSAKSTALVVGDLLSAEDCRRAAEGTLVVYHLAAGIEKSFAGAFMNSVLTTRNLMDAFLKYGQPKRFVNVSSFAVYSNLNLRRGALLDENCPLEDAPKERFDPYGYGKLKQDELVMEYGRQFKLPYVIVRPGAVFGPGKPKLSGRVAIDTFGFLVHLGGSNPLPLTYVDNCAEAIVLAGLKPGVEGETFNVVDDDAPTSKEFLRDYKKQTGVFSVSVPYAFTELLCAGWEKYARASRNQLPPVFNRRRCSAEWKGNHYSNRKLKERLGWKPRVDMKSAIASFLAQFSNS